ncbi:hypothetical protein DFH07DRAFT_951595 [Mycena maculata]|uniref:F-box domain-containing protein n=1 Tax=Mycena maculata TaxID=230809 RepID=A0AAD7K4I8_9AGAR|nr:hypothetical protein DFH07DRAFT_951595 [Mycena maculata]
MHGLAQYPLLQLSQVSKRWYNIVMETSSFWSTIELKGSTRDWSQAQIDTMMQLLQCALERSGHSPLTVEIEGAPHDAAVESLAQHCRRWKTVRLFCDSQSLQQLSAVKGRLPLLETLQINTFGTPPEPVDVFEVAPSLKDFTISGPVLATIICPPLEHLHECACVDLLSSDIAMAEPLMSILSPTTEHFLEFHIDEWRTDHAHQVELNIPPTISNICHLWIEVEGRFYRPHCEQALGGIFASLTLPQLKTLSFQSDGRVALAWPHSEFISLCHRSSFHTRLRSLDLRQVDVTGTQLLQCLSVLNALEELSISDQLRNGKGSAPPLLIRDSLL